MGLTASVVIGIVLVVAGAGIALTVERLLPAAPARPAAAVETASSTASQPSPEGPTLSPDASPQAVASSAPSAAPSPAAPILEAEMPRAINGTALTIQSATNAASLGSDSSARALSAAMASLGKKPADLEIAEAYDPAGALAVTVLGFRVAGVEPVKLRTVVLESWLSTGTPGVTSSSLTLAGTPTTVVSYGDGGPSNFVLVHGDSTFVVVTSDQALAASAVSAIAAPSSAGSPAAASPGASPAPAASPGSPGSPKPSPTPSGT
jgi:hypothetical protein